MFQGEKRESQGLKRVASRHHAAGGLPPRTFPSASSAADTLELLLALVCCGWGSHPILQATSDSDVSLFRLFSDTRGHEHKKKKRSTRRTAPPGGVGDCECQGAVHSSTPVTSSCKGLWALWRSLRSSLKLRLSHRDVVIVRCLSRSWTLFDVYVTGTCVFLCHCMHVCVCVIVCKKMCICAAVRWDKDSFCLVSQTMHLWTNMSG